MGQCDGRHNSHETGGHDDYATVQRIGEPSYRPLHQRAAEDGDRHENGNARCVCTKPEDIGRTKGPERSRGNAGEEDADNSDWRTSIECDRPKPGLTEWGPWRGRGKRNGNHRQRDQDRDQGEQEKVIWIAERKQHLADHVHKQGDHGVDAHDQPPVLVACTLVQPTFYDEVEARKTEACHQP
ncbi:hypothetical protein NKH72_34350 [Mesorhizobium sp. M0955]